MRKLETLNSKLEGNSKSQAPKRQQITAPSLEFGAWSFSGRLWLECGVLRLVIALLCLEALSPFGLCAQTNAAKASRPSASRYLFIVDTSRAMKNRADG